MTKTPAPTATQTNVQATLATKLAESKEPATLVVEEKFQEYKSARPSVRLITEEGIRVTFTNFRLLTQTKEVIAYIDKELARNGLPGISKGALLTLDEVNPMQTLRRQIEMEMREKLKQEAADAATGVTRDMGESALQKLNATSSNQVAK